MFYTMFKRRVYAIAFLAGALSACSGAKPHKVTELQEEDKTLGCSDIMLEINEAEFYRSKAEKKKEMGVKTVLLPVTYMSGVMHANDAIDAADSRIDYLNRIYDIRDCDTRKEQLKKMQQAMPIQQPQPQLSAYQMSGGYQMAPVGYGGMAPVIYPPSQTGWLW